MNGKKPVSRLESRAGVRFLPYGRQLIEEDDVEAVAGAMRSGWLTTGPAVRAFEETLAAKVQGRYAVSCASGTAGLHLAMIALGIGSGDAVVVPTVTFVATANVVRHVGAEVVFADVDPDTGLMGAAQFAEALERAGDAPVKAVIPVHFAGQCAGLAEIARLAGERGIDVVEDACHAIGTRYDGTLVGSCRDSIMAVFSFHPVKTIAMGEGGAVTTNDQGLCERLRLLRNHGMTREPESFTQTRMAFDGEGSPNPWYYEIHEMGFNYRASDLHCALGLSQLGKLDRFIAKRRQLADLYDELLAPYAPVVRPLGRVSGCRPAWHLYVVLIDFAAMGFARNEMMNTLREEGIGSQVHFIPVHKQPYYARRYGNRRLPGADAYYARTLSLPLHPGMDEADAERVVDVLGRSLPAMT